jgi:hypothetical protein
MGAALWSYQNGAQFSTSLNGFELLILRTGPGGAFRFQLLRSMSDSEQKVSIASGHHQHLADAMAEAERVSVILGSASAVSRFARRS